MPAFLETIGHGIYVLRAGANAEKYGDPYTASGTVITVGDGLCEVKGFTRREDDLYSTVKMFFDIKKCLVDAGFTKYQWERQTESGAKTVVVDLT